MLLTSWIRTLRKKFFGRRYISRGRRKVGSTSQIASRRLHLAEFLEERALLSALVIDTSVPSTAATPGINILNSTLDANNDGVSDYDNLVIASSDSAIVVSGAGTGIRIDLSNLTGLNHITVENVIVTGGVNVGGLVFNGISISLNNVPIQSLTVDQSTVTTTNATGIDINLQNIGTSGGADITVKDSTVRSTGNANGVQVTLGSTTTATHIGALTFADSTLSGIGVTSTAGTGFQTLIDQTSVYRASVQDGAVPANARSINYNLNRTTVGDFRVEDNVQFRGLSVTATDSPLQAVTVADNTNINVGAAGATDGIRINASSTNTAGTIRSDITNLIIEGNTISGVVGNLNTVNGIVLNLSDSNLGQYDSSDNDDHHQAGGTITGNTIRNLSSPGFSAIGLQITATASRTFVNGNAGRPLLLDFDGDTARDDLNGISNNILTPVAGVAGRHINGQGFVVNTTADTSFRADITGNTIQNINREGMSFSFRDKPTTDLADLVTGVTAATLAIPFVNASVLPTVPFTIQIEQEQMLVTAVSGSNLTVTRGVNGTLPAIHTGTANNPLDIDRVVAAGQLTSMIGSADTLLTLTDPISLPATPFTIQVEQEQMRVTAVNGTTLTVTRGINSTVAVSHTGTDVIPVQVSLVPDSFDSFTLNLDENVVDQTRRAGVDLTMTNTAIGSFTITNNQITGVEDVPANTPDGLSISLLGTNVTQEATATLKKSFIENNSIGVTAAGVAGQISGNGVFITAQEATQIQDLQIRNNTVMNSLQNGLSFVREDQATLRTVNPESGQNRAITISGNTIGLSAQDGVSLNVRNGSLDLLDFDIRGNFIGTDAIGTDLGNTGDGIDLLTQADARLLADLTGNSIRFNNGSGVNARDDFGDFTTDKRQIGGTWISNTISNNSQSGITIRGRHGLFDEITGLATPLVIGLEGVGLGNNIENNSGNGIRINEPQRNAGGAPTTLLDARDFRSVAKGEVSITNNLIRGNSATDLTTVGEIANSRGGIYIHSANEKVDIRHNQIEANFGKGIDIQVVHDIPTLPTNVGLPGNIQATIRDNVITGQIQIGAEQGDGIELSSYELVLAGISGRSNNALLNRMDVLALNNFIDSNDGRGVDLLNIANGTMQVRFGDNTEPGRNTIVGNGLDGFRVINTNDRTQPQDGLPTAAEPIGTPVPQQNDDILFSPDIMLDVSQNTIRDNGINLPTPVQQGGVSQVNGAGLVVLAAGVGYGNINPVSGGENSFAATFPNEVGVSSGDPLDGNGRINLRVDSNDFEGNFGNDIAIIPYIAVIPPQTQVPGNNGSWPIPNTSFAIAAMWHDGLARVNAVVTGNSGNGLDVIRVAPDYTNNETWHKSRVGGGEGPFGSATRPRNATRLASDGSPLANRPGFTFVFPGIDEGANSRQTGDGSLTPQATTLRVETGFDRSGTTDGFAFFTAGPGPGSDDNFDDHVVGNQPIINGRVDTVWDSVLLGTFTFPDVDSPSSLRASVSPFTTPRNTTPGVVTINFSEYVRFVDITDLRLLQDGVPVSLVGLAVSPVNNTQDPNNPGAFSSFTVDLSTVTAVSGNYELQVLAVDSSNPTFSPIRDIHLQLNGQGNSLVRVIDGDGILQDFALNHQFTVDNGLPVGTIVAIDPDPRNAAAGIVTVNFSESVTGVDINDFELTRNGVPVNLGSVTVVQVSATEYTLNLNQLTGAAGNYELRLVSTDLITPIIDSANNPVFDAVMLGVAASDSWDVDTTLPYVASIVTTPATSPSNTPVSTVLINFSEDVFGVSIDDLTLTFVNSAGTLSNVPLSSIVVFQNTASQYELDLSTVSLLEGSYTLTVNAVNAGIFDTAQNAFESDLSASWELDLTAPMDDAVDIVNVAPDPRTAPVDSLTTIFGEPVSGLTIGEYILAYDDGTSATGGAITDSTNSADIVVTSAAHGLSTGDEITVYGVLGNTNTNGFFTITVDPTDPFNKFSLDGSSGNDVYAGGGRWARKIDLGASTLTQANAAGTRWLANLSTVTNNPGIYIVSLLSNAGAIDAGGNQLASATGQFNVAAQDIWTYGPDAAPVGVITALPLTIGTNAGVIEINFSEPLKPVLVSGSLVTPVDLADFQLKRTVGAVVTTFTTAQLQSLGATINQTSATSFEFDLSATGLTDANGSYELSLLTTDSGSPVRDATNNLLQATFATGIASQITWTKVAADPSVTAITGVFTDPTFNTDPLTAGLMKLRSVQNLTINFSVPVTFTNGLTDASQYFRLTRQGLTGGGPVLPVSLDGVLITQVTTQQYRINVNTLTGADGNYTFTVLASEAIRSSVLDEPLLNSRTLTWRKDATIRPNQFTDAVDFVGVPVLGNEVIRTSAGAISLRAAVQETNALAGDDVIELAVGTYVLTASGVQEDFAVSGDLDIRGNLTIRGKGVGQTIIDASGLPALQRDRIFQIIAGATLNLQGVTLVGGSVLGSEDGGAIRNSGTLIISDAMIGTTDATLVATKGNKSQDDAGAILNGGTATITRTTIAGNTAGSTGGAIRNQGTLTVTNSTFSGNVSTSHGGALMNVTTGIATLEGVTISANQATSGAGGGIRNDGNLTLINDTIAFNRSIATQGGAGISRNPLLGTVTIGNTIVSNNQFTNLVANDLAGTFISRGGNIIQTPGAAIGFGALDLLNANPNLQALSSNGGPTRTHAIQFNSIAVDFGQDAIVTDQTTSSTDQRGAPRFLNGPNPLFDAVDSGAFEFGTFFVNTTADTPDVILNNGLAQDGLGFTSLRAAIMESNVLAGENAIILDGLTYRLTRGTTSSDSLVGSVTNPFLDTVAPALKTITGVPALPYATGSVGNVVFEFTEAVGSIDPLTGLLGPLTINDFQITRTGVAAAPVLTATMLTKLSDTRYQLNLSTLTGLNNGQYTIGISPAQTIRDAEGNLFVRTAKDLAVFVRGTDTFAPTVTIDPVTPSPRLTNAGIVRVTFNELVNNVTLGHFSLTRDVGAGPVAVSLTGTAITNAPDTILANRTVVTLNLATLTALDGIYQLTLNPTVGTTTIRDRATIPNNLAAAQSIAWTKAAGVQFNPVTPNPRNGSVSSVTLQFSENVAGVTLADFALTYDDASGIGPQIVDFTTFAPLVATLTAVTPTTTTNGPAASQWTLTFPTNASARDGVYALDFVGTSLFNVAGNAFVPNLANTTWAIGEDAATIGDLDLDTTTGALQIIGGGANSTINALGLTVAPSVINGQAFDRIFDVLTNSVVSVSGIEMTNGKVVLERNGGAIRNLGSLTVSNSEILNSVADGNGGGISNGNSLQAGTLVLNNTSMQSNIAGSATVGSQFGKGGAIFNDSGSVTIAAGTYSSNTAFTDGGVIYNDNNTSVLISSATFDLNKANRDGGALYNGDTSTLTIRSTTLSSNIADNDNNGDGEGGAIYTEGLASLQLDDSILRSNRARVGGALYNDDATLVLSDNSFEQNTALNDAGAIYNSVGGTLTLNDGLFTENSAVEDGGAIQNYGALTITLTEFLKNRATSTNGRGGAIYNEDGTVSISEVEFNQNTSTGEGGAIYNSGDGNLSLSRVTLDSNRATRNGGAIYNNDFAQLTVDQTSFATNSAVLDGGALYNNSEFASGTTRSATITASTLNNNSAVNGGAIFNTSLGGVTLQNSTLSSNTATLTGGGLANYGAAELLNDTVHLNDAKTTITATTALTADIVAGQTSFVVNSVTGLPTSGSFVIQIESELMLVTTVTVSTKTLIVVRGVGGTTDADHVATVAVTPTSSGAGIVSNFDGSAPLATVTLTNTIISGGTTVSDASGPDANFIDGGNNLIEEFGTVLTFSAANGNLLGVSPQLDDDLKDNGGASRTHALLFGSPARDAGNNIGTTVGDQRGFTRIFDGDGNGIATVDIGAFESGFIINSFADTIDENINDGINADRFGVSTLRATIMQANARVGEDTIILSPGTYSLDLGGRDEDAGTTGDLDVLGDLNIIGSGTDQTFIDALEIDRIFHVLPNVRLNLSNLTLVNGNASSTDNGGAILNQGILTLRNVHVLSGSAARGGGIFNAGTGTLTIDQSLLRGNESILQGGAIYNDGALTLTRSELGVASFLDVNLAKSFTGTLSTVGGINSVVGTFTVSSVSQFPTSGQFYIQIDSEVMLVTSVVGTTLNVTRGQLNTTAASHAFNSAIAPTTVTVDDVTPFSSEVPFIIQIDSEQLRVMSISGNDLTVVRAINGVRESHTTNTLVTQGNFSNAHGGGLYNLGTATISEDFFVGNVSNSRGGGIFNAASTSTLAVAVAINANTITLVDASQFPTSGQFVIQVDLEQMLVTAVAGNVLTVTRPFGVTAAAVHNIGARVTSIGLNTVDIQRTTFADNFASSRGAAIYNEDVLNVTNSTLSTNASGTNAAIGNTLTGQVDIRNSTIVDNVAYRGGGIANTTLGSVEVKNTILAKNVSTALTGVKAQDARGTIISNGNNFVGNNADSSGFVINVMSDQVGSATSPFDPVIEGLSNNGGLTLTQSPRGGSPAIDAGENSGGDTTDQRGATRPTNSDSDIGAVEVQDIHLKTFLDVSLSEGNSGSTLFDFVLTLDKASVEEIRIGYATQGDTAFAGEDFIAQTGTVVFAPGELTRTITIEVNGDLSIENDEQFFVNLFNPENVTLDDNTRAVGTIRTEDTGFRITDVNKVEKETGSAAQTYTFEVSIIGAAVTPGSTATVTYTIVDGDLTVVGDELVRGATRLGPDADYSLGATLATALLTFTADASGLFPVSQFITVTVSGDDRIEKSEYFDVQLSAASLPFEFGKDKGVGTIFNDDLGFSITGTSANERNPSDVPSTTSLAYTVTLRERVYSDAGGSPVQLPVTATVSTNSGTATDPQDFTPINFQALPAFTGNTLSQTVTATVQGDLRYEVSNIVPLAMNFAAGATTLTLSPAIVQALPAIRVGEQFVILIDNEQMLVTDVDATLGTLTVSRNFNGTGDVLHTAPAMVRLNGEVFSLAIVGGAIDGTADSNTASQSISGLGFINDNDSPPDSWRVVIDTSVVLAGEIVVFFSDNGAPEVEHYRTADLATAIVINGDEDGVFGGPGTPVGVAGTDQDDLFIVDFGNGSPIPTDAGGLRVIGMDQVGADTLQLIDPTNFFTFNNVIYNSANANSGSVEFVTFGTIFYVGLEPVLDLTNADNRTFNAPALGNDNIVLSSGNGLTTISSVIGSSPVTFESVTFRNPTTAVVVNANGGTNNIQVSGGDATFTSSLTINAGDGDDTINAAAWTLPSTLNGEGGFDTINGGSAGDFITGGDEVPAVKEGDLINGNGGDDTILAGAGNDTVIGGAGQDFVNGDAGDDSIEGNGDVDTLTGGADNDIVDGGAGDETVDGGTGNDTVIGGAGMDTLTGGEGHDSLSGGTENDSLDGGNGEDTLSGDSGTDTINGGDGLDVVATSMDVNQTVNNLQVILVGVETDVLEGLTVEGARLVGGASNNILNATAFSGAVTLVGGLGNDSLTGTTFNDVIVGGFTLDFTGLDAIDEAMNINDGNDTINGGLGNDTINGNGGNDSLLGGDDDDSILGGAGNDTVNAGIGADNVQGNGGSDSLIGGNGIDTLIGGFNSDTLRGGEDGDILFGGLEHDPVLDLDDGDPLNLDGSDSLFGDAGEDTIEGGAGVDVADGGTGNDSVAGGNGNDILNGGDGDDSVNGNEGNDTLNGQVGKDTLYGGSGDDSMIATSGDDVLIGQGGSSDTFVYEGDLTLADLFTISAAGDGGVGSPQTGIGLARTNLTTFTIVILETELFTLNLNGGNDTVTIGDLSTVVDLSRISINGGLGNDTIDGTLSPNVLVGLNANLGDGTDSFLGTAGNDTVYGDLGSDFIVGNEGDDSIFGGDGTDNLNGNAGNDTISGGAGDDSIQGGTEDDSLAGDDGKDSIYGQDDLDSISGGNHDDLLDGGIGSDTIFGGAGNDKIAGRDDGDSLFGELGNDTIKGGKGNDSISGGGGIDIVNGDEDADYIQGDSENDFLLGGSGNDTILGGAGNDVCMGMDGVDKVDGQGGSRDTVLGGNGTGTNTMTPGDIRVGASNEINELFKILVARPSIFSELNF